MSPFESFLSGQFEDYIAYRQNLGYDTKSLLWVLRTLDRHLLEKKPALTDLTSAFFLSLKTSLHVQRKSINCLLSTTRMFFNYLVRKDVCQDNPLKDIPLLAEERFIPFIFSPAQIDRLLEALGRSLRREPTLFCQGAGHLSGDFASGPLRHAYLRTACGLSGITSVPTTTLFMSRRPSSKKTASSPSPGRWPSKSPIIWPCAKACGAPMTTRTCWRPAPKNPSTIISSAPGSTKPWAILASVVPDKPSAPPTSAPPPPQPQAQLCGQHLKTHHRNRPIPAARPAGAGRLPGPLRIQTHDQISEAPGRQPPA